MLDLIILALLFAELEFIKYNFIFFSTMNYFYLERIIMFFIEKIMIIDIINVDQLVAVLEVSLERLEFKF
jgi:hypothetical protein